MEKSQLMDCVLPGDRIHSVGGVRVLAVRDGGQAGGDDGEEAGQPRRGVPAPRHRPKIAGMNDRKEVQ